MAHILFADMSQAGVWTMRRAVRQGHRVTLVLSTSTRTYAVDDAFSRLLDELARVVEIPRTDDEEALAEAIGAVHAADPVDAVISQCDPILEALAAVCERLALPFTSSVGIGNARDKARARRRLAEAGLRSARFDTADTAEAATAAADRIGYPVVVKPLSGLDSMLAAHARDAGEVAAAASAILASARDPATPDQIRALLDRGILVEEYLAGELVSAEVGVLDGTCHRFLVSGRSRGRHNDCVELGAALPADIAPDTVRQCFEYAENVCRALGLDFGVFHVEIMLTARGPALVEVNPRVMGGVMTRLYEILTGVDFCDFVIDIHLGRIPRPVALDSTRTVTARRIMPLSDDRLGDRLDLSWLDREATDIVNFENFRLTAGAAVRRQEVLGRYAVVGADWAGAMHRADDLLRDFERHLGIPLVQP
jgi:biotin carboxylase